MRAANLAFRTLRFSPRIPPTARALPRLRPPQSSSFAHRSFHTRPPLQQPRSRPRYQRFGESTGSEQWSNFGPVYRAQYLWRNYRPAILITAGGGGAFYVYNLEDVPITHRRRFNVMSPRAEEELAAGEYQNILNMYKGKILPTNHQYTQLVAKVVERLLPFAAAEGLASSDGEWRVHVIDEPNEKNAFVIPGGKVFVFTGILPICQDEEGLAAVLGHEIAHNLVHHLAERASTGNFFGLAAIAASALLGIDAQWTGLFSNLLFSLPNSRTQEEEADHIGLLMMAQSCYDPEAAVQFWKRMKEAEKFSPPQFLSTHPSSYNRMNVIETWLPEARRRYDESECGRTSAFARDFAGAFGMAQQQRQRRPQQVPVHVSRPQDDDDDFF